MLCKPRLDIPTRLALAGAMVAVAGLVAGCGRNGAPAHDATGPSANLDDLPARGDRMKVGVADRWSDGNIWLILSDGTWVRQLTSLPGTEGEMSWSPDGRQIIFDANDGIYVIGIDGAGLDKVVGLSNWVGHGPAWSPTADLILLTDGRLGTMRPDGTELHLLPGTVAGEHGSWSPDGARFTFMGTGPIQPWDIFTADADGSNVRNLTHNTFYESFPAWSPDGKRIAYGAEPANSRDVGVLVTTDIFVMNPDGTRAMNITNGDPATPGFPEWLPDGRLSFFTQAGELWLTDADGGHPQMIATGCGPVAWRP